MTKLKLAVLMGIGLGALSKLIAAHLPTHLALPTIFVVAMLAGYALGRTP